MVTDEMRAREEARYAMLAPVLAILDASDDDSEHEGFECSPFFADWDWDPSRGAGFGGEPDA